MRSEELKSQILELTKDYYKETYGQVQKYSEGGRVNYAGRCFNEKEMINLVDSALEFWLTAGRYTNEFEQKLASYLGIRYCSVVNSGSSANLIAFMTLTSYKLGDRRIKKGDEVITVAAAFPTTVAPIIQFGAVPVFVDVTIPQYNIDVTKLEEAYSSKTKAVMIAHTLGNPFDIQTVKEFCDRHKLWLIEDNCDALGSEYLYCGKLCKTGTIGDIATSSFYPPHHITMGEGGAVYTNQQQLHRIINSFRDWGRDCYCAPGQDGSCGCRYGHQFGELPVGYDHKYVYSHFGYNLKATDMQAAIGSAQLEKLETFTEIRRKNWNYLNERLKDIQPELILPSPLPDSQPSWFGYALTVSDKADFTRNDLVEYLEARNIQTRNLFAGNLIKHPCFDEFRGNDKIYRIAGSLENSDIIMNDTFWIGVYPGMTNDMLEYMAAVLLKFIEEKRKNEKS